MKNYAKISKYGFVLALVFLILFGFQLQAGADILYLKNGRTIEGIIKKEDSREVSLNVGFGVMKFSRGEIKSIHKSSEEGVRLIEEGWVKEKEASEARAKEIQEQKEREPKQAMMDKKTGHLAVETTLNKKVKANLVLDTGSSLVVLSSKIASSLGIDVSAEAGDTMDLILADGRKVKVQKVILDSVSVQGAEVEKVEAAILPEQDNSLLDQDGLLGMSFLKNFSFKIDQKNNKLTLEKL